MTELKVNGFTAKVIKDKTIACCHLADGTIVDVEIGQNEKPKRYLSRMPEGAVKVFVQRARYVRYMLKALMVQRSGTVYDIKIHTLAHGKWAVRSERKTEIY